MPPKYHLTGGTISYISKASTKVPTMRETNETANKGLSIVRDSENRWQVCRHYKTGESFKTFETLAAAMAYAYSLFTFNS